MTTMTWSDVLNSWKEEDNSDCVLALTNNPDLRMVAYGFSVVEVTWKPTDNPCGDDSKDWSAAWRGTTFNPEDIEAASMVGLRTINRHMNTLIAVRAIFPDGTLNKYTKQLLSAITRQKLAEALGR